MVEKSPGRRILELFFRRPEAEIHLREIEKLTGISIATVSKYVNRLEEEDLVKVRKVSNMKFVEANLDNESFRDLKKAYNLESIYTSGLAEFLQENLRPEAVVLFGSYSRGEDHEESDIDIAVINGRDKKVDLTSFEEELMREINLHSAEEADTIDENFRNTLANGIVIHGYLKVV